MMRELISTKLVGIAFLLSVMAGLAIFFVGSVGANTVPTGSVDICVGLQVGRSDTMDEPIEWTLTGGASPITGSGVAEIMNAPGSTVGCFEVAGYPTGVAYDLYIDGADHLGLRVTAAELGGPLPAPGAAAIDVSATNVLIDGDANDDGVIDFLDISAVLGGLTIPFADASGSPAGTDVDFDENNQIDFLDISNVLGDFTIPFVTSDS